jgi:hypothetical protein
MQINFLGMGFTYQNKKISSYKHGPVNNSFPSYNTERTHLKEVVKVLHQISNMLGHVLSYTAEPFKYSGIFADSLAGVRNVLVKCILVVNSS